MADALISVQANELQSQPTRSNPSSEKRAGKKTHHQKKQLGVCLFALLHASIFFTSVACIYNSFSKNSYMTHITHEHVFFQFELSIMNQPTERCSQVGGWETESTAPSTATIQPRSAVAVLEAEHVAPHAKPPWHSVSMSCVHPGHPQLLKGKRHLVGMSKIHQKQNCIHVFHKKISTHLYLISTLYTSTWESKCRSSFKNMKSNSISKQNSHFWTPKKLLVAHGEVPGGELPQVECHQPPNPRTPKRTSQAQIEVPQIRERSGASPMVQRLSL